MSKARDRLTAVQIKNLSKPGFYHDGGGLYLQISRFGSKSWILRYTLNQKKRDMGLGPLTDWTLAEARERGPGLDQATEHAGEQGGGGAARGAVPAADSMDGAPARSDSAHPPPTPYIQRFRPSVRPEVVHTIHHFQEDAAVCWFPPDSLLFLHQENLFSGNFPPSPFLLLWIRCPRPPPSSRLHH